MLGAQPVADDAAPVVADHVRAVDAEVVEEGDHVARNGAHRQVAVGRYGGGRVAGERGHDRAEAARGERLRQAPHADRVVGEAVQHEHVGAVAERPDGEVAAAERDDLRLVHVVLRSPASTSGTTTSGRSRCGQCPAAGMACWCSGWSNHSSRPANSAGRMHCDCVP